MSEPRESPSAPCQLATSDRLSVCGDAPRAPGTATPKTDRAPGAATRHARFIERSSHPAARAPLCAIPVRRAPAGRDNRPLMPEGLSRRELLGTGAAALVLGSAATSAVAAPSQRTLDFAALGAGDGW